MKKHRPKIRKSSGKNMQATRNTPTALPESKSELPKNRRFLRTINWFLGPPFAFLLFVFAFRGPLWPTQPIFSAQVPSSGSPFDVPFDVTNKSGLFDIYNLAIHCEILTLAAKRITITEDSKVKLLIPSNGPNPILRATVTSSFTCPFSKKLDENGLGRSALDEPRRARIVFIVEYDSPWKVLPWTQPKMNTASDFTLDTDTRPPRWVPGIPLR